MSQKTVPPRFVIIARGDATQQSSARRIPITIVQNAITSDTPRRSANPKFAMTVERKDTPLKDVGRTPSANDAPRKDILPIDVNLDV
jgi:hypothetical protein